MWYNEVIKRVGGENISVGILLNMSTFQIVENLDLSY